MKYLKNNIGALILIFLSIAIGTVLITFNNIDFISIFSYVMAGYMAVLGLCLVGTGIFRHIWNEKTGFLDSRAGYLVQGAVLIGLAAVLILFQDYAVRVAIGVTFLIHPTYQLIFADDKKKFLIRNSWKYLLGILFILTVKVLIRILFITIGIAFCGAAGFLIYLLIINAKDPEKPNILSKYIIIYIVKRNNKE